MGSIALTQLDFLNRAYLVHGNKYEYSNVCFISAKDKVQIICNIHGIFEQRPDDHCFSKKQGCPSCSGNKRGDIQSFISKAK